MEQTLKQTRERAKITQSEAAAFLNVSLRSYKSYENDPDKEHTLKYKYMLREIQENWKTDETHGILSIDEISAACSSAFSDYPVEFCYLFGSYAKGKARENSDVDLLIATDLKGLRYFGLVDRLRTGLKKNVDVLDLKQLTDNPELTREILKDGIKIYG